MADLTDDIFDFLDRAFVQPGKAAAGGYMGATSNAWRLGANTFDLMDKTADYIGQKAGLGKPDALRTVANYMRGAQQRTGETAQRLAQEGSKGLPGAIYGAVGAAPIEVPKMMAEMAAGGPAGMALTGALQRADEGAGGAAKGALTGLTGGMAATLPLTRVAGAAVQGGLGGAQAAAQTSDPNEVLKQALIGGMFGAAMPSGSTGLKQLGQGAAEALKPSPLVPAATRPAQMAAQPAQRPSTPSQPQAQPRQAVTAEQLSLPLTGGRIGRSPQQLELPLPAPRIDPNQMLRSGTTPNGTRTVTPNITQPKLDPNVALRQGAARQPTTSPVIPPPPPGTPPAEALTKPAGGPRIESAGTPAAPFTPERPQPKYAASINLRRATSPEEMMDVYQQMAAGNKARIDEARGSSRSLEQTQQFAKEAGISFEDLWTKRGQPMSDVEITSARQFLSTAAYNAGESAKAIRSGKNADANLVKFDADLARFGAAFELVSGASTQIGRALSAHRIQMGRTHTTEQAEAIKAAIAARGGALKVSEDFTPPAMEAAGPNAVIRQPSRASRKGFNEDLIEMRGGKDKLQDTAKKFADMMDAGVDPKFIPEFLNGVYKTSIPDQIHWVWSNAILSSLKTDVRNIAGSFGKNLVDTFVTKPLAAAATAPRRMAGGQQGYTPDRLGGAVSGFFEGGAEALGLLGRELKTGTRQVPMGAKTLRDFESAFRPMTPWGEPKSAAGKAALGAIIPYNRLRWEDNFLKTMFYRQRINEEATSLPPAARDAFRMDPEAVAPELHAAAVKDALEGTFQQRLGKIGQVATTVRNNIPGGRYIAPFVQTSINLIKSAAEYSPLGVVKGGRMAAQGAPQADVDVTMARAMVGSILASMAYWAAYNDPGSLTGAGPRNPNERQLWNQTNQPSAIRVGNTSTTFSGLDPLALVANTGADLGDQMRQMNEEMPDATFEKKAGELAGRVFSTLMRNFSDRQYTNTVFDVIQALQSDNPTDELKRLSARTLAGFAPNMMADIARMTDPVMRDTRSDTYLGEIGNAVKARTPGLSQTLPPRTDFWGKPIQYEGALGPDIASPFFQTTNKEDPVAREMLRLGMAPGASAFRSLNKFSLPTDWYNEYKELARGPAKEKLTEMLSDPNYLMSNDERKAEKIDKVLRRYAAHGRKEMLSEHPELRERDTRPYRERRTKRELEEEED